MASATVEFGPDRGQNFGTLFEVTDASGRVVAGAGFAGVRNTQPRGDRELLQVFLRPAGVDRDWRVERLPYVDSPATGFYPFGIGGQLYICSRSERGRIPTDPAVYRWYDAGRAWVAESNVAPYAERVAGKLLAVTAQSVAYDGKSLLEPEAGARFAEHYFAGGNLFLRETSHEANPRVNRLIVCPWRPERDTSLARREAWSLELPIAHEFIHTFAQRESEVLAVSNNGRVLRFDGQGWMTLREPVPNVSYQVYTALTYYDRLLLGHYPTGEIIEYDGRELRQCHGWPPVPPGVSPYVKELQTLAIYGGDVYAGVWPWGEVWRYERDGSRWVFMQRMFDHPQPTDAVVHPYEAETLRVDTMANLWGQRVTGLYPHRAGLLVTTSSKIGTAWDSKFGFLTEKQRADYRATYLATVPGNLAVAIEWKPTPTRFEIALAGNTLSVSQDGKPLGSVTVPEPFISAFRPDKLTWGQGMFGPLAGKLSEPSANVPVAANQTTIVVNFGSHSSAEAAAQSENQVNWTDADTSNDTICTECFAAIELQRCLRKASGRAEDFAIVDDDTTPAGDLILVGGTASNRATKQLEGPLGIVAEELTALGTEGYRIKSLMLDGRRVSVVAGHGRVGTLYAAYDLLYRLGCRWFAPEKAHEDIPRIEAIPDLDATERPSYRIRGFLAWEDRASPEFLQWMARNRLNLWCHEQREHSLMHKLGIHMDGGDHDAVALFVSPHNNYPYAHPRFQADAKLPKDPYPVSPEYQGDTNKDGKLSYFEAHPEWYAWDGKQRIPGLGEGLIQGRFGVNYCTSNADATAEFMKNYVQALADGRYRDADIIRFWMLDGGRWCQCNACNALGTSTDRNLLLVHQFDQAIKKARAEGKIHRPILIRFLIYNDILEPPTRPLPKNFDYKTSAGTFFPIRRCFVHVFDDPDCTINSDLRKQMAGWITDPNRHYRGQIGIGEYYNVSVFNCLPICFMHGMAHDIPYYCSQAGGEDFLYMHVTTANWGSKALTNYQMARQTWNFKCDCEPIWNDYFARRYGPAAETMRSFYESLEKMLSNCNEIKNNLAARLDQGVEDLFPSSQLRYRCEPGEACVSPTWVETVELSAASRKLIDQALAADLPERIRANIVEDDGPFIYAQRTIAYYDACIQAFQLGREGKLDEARKYYAEARRIAELLRKDTTSTSHTYMSSTLPMNANAFAATLATKALDYLAQLLDEKPATGGK